MLQRFSSQQLIHRSVLLNDSVKVSVYEIKIVEINKNVLKRITFILTPVHKIPSNNI